VDPRDIDDAERVRSELERGRSTPAAFRAALLGVRKPERDAWCDRALGLGEPPADGPDLPRGCVPYLPCPVDALLRMLEASAVGGSDVFVDVGSGAGRTAALVSLLTGAAVVGLEVQRELARGSRALATRLKLRRITIVEGDASVSAGSLAQATVFFLYCPFSGERTARLLNALEAVARSRALRIGCLDLLLPDRPWLVREPLPHVDLALYRTTLHGLGSA
jgi:hypothetical protein